MKKITPIQAIRTFCKECNGEARISYDCMGEECPLYVYKKGRGKYETESEHLVTEEHKKFLKEFGIEYKTRTKNLPCTPTNNPL